MKFFNLFNKYVCIYIGIHHNIFLFNWIAEMKHDADIFPRFLYLELCKLCETRLVYVNNTQDRGLVYKQII